jgi:intracellular septation protein
MKKEIGAGTRLLLDLGPLLVFLVSYWTTKQMFLATGLFMAATVVSIVVSRLKVGHVSPLLWFSGAMVLVLGGLTIWLHNETFIKVKPTIYYLMVAGILFFGLLTKRPTLKLVLGSAYPGLSERGWAVLSCNWALFFLAMAVANEIVWRHTTTDFWLSYKLWGAMPATFLFALANVPMLMKHGMNASPEVTDGSQVPPVE